MGLPSFYSEMRVGSDPKLTFTQSGMAIASFSAVADKRKKNEQTGEWETDKQIWVRVTAFKKLAENVAESITKGSLVVISGYIHEEEYTTKEGEKRKSIEVTANEIGLSLAFDPATSMKADRSSGGAQKATSPASADPWASSPSEQPAF